MFYAKVIDLKILVALGKIEALQTSRTIETKKAMQKILDYFATHPNATLRYTVSRMVIKAHSGASYFSESQARRITGGFFYMVGANYDSNLPNGAIMVISTIICNVISLAA